MVDGKDEPLKAAAQGRVLAADDDPVLLKAIERLLVRARFSVECVPDGTAAVDALRRESFDVIVSDITMPGLDGVGVLRAARAHDPDVPFILVTGAPELSTAIEALRLGALDYVIKPFDSEKLVQTVARANLLHRMARVKREALDLVSDGGLGVSDRAGLEASFDRALSSIWMAYQPIVRMSERVAYGYEALMRSDEKTLPHPGAVLDAAERLGRVADVGRRVRALAPTPMGSCDSRSLLFVNLHASDLTDDALADPDTPLAAMASRVVLEITERASLDEVLDVRSRIAALRALGFRIAIDDLGAGYAGLTSFASLEPEFVKIDMSLVRGVDASTTKQKLVRSVVSLCGDLGMQVIAEGVETVAERDALLSLGCDLLQGYLLARPGKPFPALTW